MKYKQFESGRSMVEILGVLTIIGVLSVGGVAGYKYGIEKYRSNDLVHEINLRTITLLSQFSQSQQLNLSEFETTTPSGYEFTPPEQFEDSVALTALNVPQNICELTLDTLFPQTIQIDINGTPISASSPCEKDNDITFYFPTSSNTEDIEQGQNGCPIHLPVYNETSKKCETCPSNTPKFNSETQTCEACPLSEQIYNEETRKCDCPSSAPYYSSADNACVECTQNSHCLDGKMCAAMNYEAQNETDPKHKRPIWGRCCDITTVKSEVINGTTYYRVNVCGESYVNYWNTQMACQFSGGEMLSLDDLVYDNNGSNAYTTLGNTLKDWRVWNESWMWTDYYYSDTLHAGVYMRGPKAALYFNSAHGSVMQTICKK
ncbi:MAG: hypothetical protein IKV03_02860 [Alphaproteobacteria bacterium]|nr:hypothetical protein [Alphaproteobacteria bacterium]